MRARFLAAVLLVAAAALAGLPASVCVDAGHDGADIGESNRGVLE